MPLTSNKNTRKQVSRNTDGIQAINDRANPVFRRISSNPIGNRIAQPEIYMVVRPHPTKYGFYISLPLQIDSDTVNAGYSTAGVKMKNKYVTLGPLDSGQNVYPDTWQSTTSYVTNDTVNVELRIYKALRDNSNKNPVTQTDDWEEITVDVLNLSEWMGWDAGVEPPGNANADAAITELLPKLINLDTIVASSQLASGGERILTGFDNIGLTRLFLLEKESSQTNDQQLTGIAIKADGQLADSNEGLHEVKIIPYSSFGVDTDSSSLNQYWVGDPQSIKHETCIWIKGMWYWTPSIQKNIGSNQDVFKEDVGLDCGRIIGTGLQTGGTGGRTDIEAIP